MPLYSIADFTVDLRCSGRTLSQARPYLVTAVQNGSPDFKIEVTRGRIAILKIKHPGWSDDDIEYCYSGLDFNIEVVRRNAIVLHASAVVLEGSAYLFSADCGTGKSTHASLWVEYFQGRDCFILNDDKPAIRKTDGRYYAYGTPWSGKEDISINEKHPVRGLCFLERADINRIWRIPQKEAFQRMWGQVIRRFDSQASVISAGILTDFLAEVPAYVLECNISPDAVITAWTAMSAGGSRAFHE